MAEFDVFGIGNAMMDILIKVDNSHLIEFDLKKGNFHLFEEEKVDEILGKLKEREHKLIPAGGTANTLMGMANMGMKCVLCGKVGQDNHGDFFEDVLVRDKIKCNLVRCNKHATGRVVNLVTPDAERTFAVSLGAAVNLETEEVVEDDLKQSRMFYFTGYEFDSARKTVEHFVELARKNKVKVAFDLADPGLVLKNLEEIQKLLVKCDVVFMNESEAEALTGLSVEEAVRSFEDEKIVVVKVGKKGSFVCCDGEVLKIEPYLKKALDTTGAGDLYAAGFLYGFLNGRDLKMCGKYGSYMASKIVSVIGGRLDCCVKEEMDNLTEE